jgi:FKBP12-rapamycin complex-associated protein
MLASAVGPNLTKLLHDQLDLFFACGLSEPLRQALMAIARNIPPLLKTIQGASVDITHTILIKTNTSDRLLDLLSMILCGQPYKAIGAPPSLVRSEVSAFTRDLSSSQVSYLICLSIISIMTCEDH